MTTKQIGRPIKPAHLKPIPRTVNVLPEHDQQVWEICRQRGASYTEVVREALVSYLLDREQFPDG